MPEPLDSLVRGWRSHFAAADSSIEWLHAELNLQTELAPGAWLCGTLDAVGRNGAGELFFGEWKTASPRERKTWKQVWRMNPQSLSYGVLIHSLYANCERFTVRKAFKENVPTYDHAWFKYELAELEHWRFQLGRIAREIREYQENWQTPWPQNFKHCYRYGPNYVCPFFDTGCNKQQWAALPSGATVGGDPTWGMTGQRAAILARDPGAIVLSPTTVETWFECRERYRRQYVELVTPPAGEALTLGKDFHSALAEYYKGMVKNGN